MLDEEGEPLPRSVEERRLRGAAERGDPAAGYRLATTLEGARRWQEAREWLCLAAEAGHVPAMRDLAWKYSERARTDPAAEEPAERWFRRLAEVTGDEDELVSLAQEMQNWSAGRTERAAGLLRRLAEDGNVRAARRLAYESTSAGDYAGAVHWYRLAAEAGSKDASASLGHWLTYLDRYEEAEAVYQRLADEGDAGARVALAQVRLRLGKIPPAVDRSGRLVISFPESCDVGLPERRPAPMAVDRGSTEPGSVADVAATALITAAVVPFFQALAAKAGEGAYEAARSLLRRRLRRDGDTRAARRTGPVLHVVQDPGSGTRLELRSGHLTDEALRELTLTDVETLTAPDPSGRQVTVYWEPAAGAWLRRVHQD